jgi:hypothetical protein
MAPASVASRGADWTVAVESILEASAVGSERVAEAVLAAASTLTASRSAALVRWHSDGPRVLFATGGAIELPALRPPEGPGLLAGRPAATVPLGASSDLVVARERREAAFDLDELRALRILAVLGARAGDRSQEAFAALYGVATKLLGSRDLEEVLLAISNATSQVLRAEIAGLFLWTPPGSAWRCARWLGTAPSRRPGYGCGAARDWPAKCCRRGGSTASTTGPPTRRSPRSSSASPARRAPSPASARRCG